MPQTIGEAADSNRTPVRPQRSRYTARAVTTTDDVRYRCAACGNLTRFDITISRQTRAFHHFTVGGELTVEDEEVLSETVDVVVCRWCGSGKAVEVLEG